MENVVITGMGCVSSLGNSPELLWQNLLAGKSGIATIQRFDASAYTSRMASEIREFDASGIYSTRDQSRFSRCIQYAVYSAFQALNQAGIAPENENPERCGAIIGSSIGGLQYCYDAAVALSTRGPSRVSPFYIPMAIVNMPAGEVCNKTGWMGPSYTVTSACATSNHSIANAYDMIRLGRCDVMLAGGADETVNPLSLAGFTSMKAVSKRNDDPERASRPFDKDRDGFVIGEGAAVLVLESESHAKARGAKILARIAGVGASSDAHHISAPRPDGKGVMLAMSNAMKEAGIEAKDISYINTHGTSTPLGDIAECSAIETLFKQSSASALENLKVNSTKSMLGHCLGAAGALESVVTIMSVMEQKVHGTLNVFEQDPEIHLDVCANGAVNQKIDYAMSNGFGFGGQNGVIIFARN
jgi:3-oxoacyl-[acyl-carrier-protein] synthase II